jgi:hypothetical protein
MHAVGIHMMSPSCIGQPWKSPVNVTSRGTVTIE